MCYDILFSFQWMSQLLSLSDSPAQWESFLSRPDLLQRCLRNNTRWREIEKLQEEIAEKIGIYHIFCSPDLLAGNLFYNFLNIIQDRDFSNFLKKYPKLATVSLRVIPAGSENAWTISSSLGYLNIPVNAEVTEIQKFIQSHGERALTAKHQEGKILDDRTELILNMKRILRLGALQVEPGVSDGELNQCCSRLRSLPDRVKRLFDRLRLRVGTKFHIDEDDGWVTIRVDCPL